MATSYLIIDIETSPMSWESFDSAQQEYLLRGAETPEAQEKKKDECALAPFTGHIVCISMVMYSLNSESGEYEIEKRVCLMKDMDDSLSEPERTELASGAVMVRYSERAMLNDFWKFLRQQVEQNKKLHFITFNGRGFDFPYLMLRSAMLGIRPSMNLMNGTRWNYREIHTDLLDELTYQMPQTQGATRRFNLDFYTKSFGIPSPKGEGVDGSKVHQLYADGEYEIIAEYCLRDVEATWLLYKAWSSLLKF
jgi:3'-5' exonuclease